MTIIEYAMKFIGKPYIWGGDGTGIKSNGFDCSGLIIECLQAFGILPSGDWTAQGLSTKLKTDGWREVDKDESWLEGDILFYGTSQAKITHITMAVDRNQFIEAGGGGSKCVSNATSTGYVRLRPRTHRKDLVLVLRKL